MAMGGTVMGGFDKDNNNNVKAILGRRTRKKTEVKKTRKKTGVSTPFYSYSYSSLLIFLTLGFFQAIDFNDSCNGGQGVAATGRGVAAGGQQEWRWVEGDKRGPN